jgi:trimeric autotransporter adhesin
MFHPVPSRAAAAAASALLLLAAAPAQTQSPMLLQLRSGSPPGDRFVVDTAGGFVAHGVLGNGIIPAIGCGVRMMWHPFKAAFRAGHANDGGFCPSWDDASIGFYSTAMGHNTTASGAASIAMGYYTAATALAATATGHNTTASGAGSTAMGVATVASGNHSTAMGSGTVASGPGSTAMGINASTNQQDGSFVYGDGSTQGYVHSTAANQATWRTTGGFRIFTNVALTNGCSLVANGINWACTSSRLEKENFAEVDGEDVLRRLREVPVTSWNGIAEGPQVRHIGPMAQDWHAAFALNDDPLTIHQGDLAGVSLVAVQALDGRTERQEERIRALEAENAALREWVEALSAGAEVTRAGAEVLRAEAAEQRARLERLEAFVAGLTPEP